MLSNFAWLATESRVGPQLIRIRSWRTVVHARVTADVRPGSFGDGTHECSPLSSSTVLAGGDTDFVLVQASETLFARATGNYILMPTFWTLDATGVRSLVISTICTIELNFVKIGDKN